MSDSTRIASDLITCPYWWDAAPPAEAPAGEIPAEVDVAIVGGGYTGLSAALELARGGASVAVLDRLAIGAGASSRNGGSVGGGLKLAGFALEKRLGRERADRIVSEAMGTLDFLEDLIARERIDCRFARTGRYIAAWSRHDFDGLKRRAEALRAAGQADTRVLEASEQSAEIGSTRYFGGMVVPSGAQIHPGLYVQGLARAAEAAGARLAGGIDVRAHRRTAGGMELDWSRADGAAGSVRARQMVAATNAYTGPLTPWLRRRIIPVDSYMIATAPFPPALRRRLDPNGRMFSDTKRLLSYFRMAPGEDRALIGGRVSFGEIDLRVAAVRLHRELTAIWPELAAVPVTHAWKGRVAFTFDFLPHLGERDGVHYALGCQGAGVAMCSYLGTKLARRILGAADADTAFAGPEFPTRPLYSGNPWFLPLVGAGYRALDAFDRTFR